MWNTGRFIAAALIASTVPSKRAGRRANSRQESPQEKTKVRSCAVAWPIPPGSEPRERLSPPLRTDLPVL